MPVKRPPLITEEIYHIVLRGVGDQRVFKDAHDYYRCIFSLFEFNTTNPVEVAVRRRKRSIQKRKGEVFSDARDKLVEVLQFCFMPNHIHLLIRQLQEGGITDFMRKFGTGYAMYFNKKYRRKGHLFQGRFYAVHVKDEQQLRTAFVYIHANPISLEEPKWKEAGIKNPKKIEKFLETYKWSSYQDFLGKSNFPSVTQRELLLDILGGVKGVRSAMRDWLWHKKALADWNVIGIE